MYSKHWILLILCIGLPQVTLGQADAGRVMVGIAPPMGQLGQSPELADAFRQNLISQLRSQSVDAVALTAPSGALLQAEAQAKHCSYVLYTRLDKKHGMTGLLGKLSTLSGSGAQQTMSAAGGVSLGINKGDTVTLDYRLLPAGSSEPLKTETFTGKAAADGPDIVVPLVAQLSAAVTAAAHGGAAVDGREGAGTAPVAATAPATSSHGASSGNPGSTAHSSFLGGLWNHKKGADTPATSLSGAGAGMDCAKLASMPGAMMTLESCQQLQGAQRSFDQAAADPSAAHPGDEQMTCTQITAEMKQQPLSAPDQSQRAGLQAAGDQVVANTNQTMATFKKEQAEAQTAVAAASAADRATEAATLGMVRGRALEATEKTLDAKNRATNERLDKENQKVAKQTFGQMGTLSSDMGAQLQANPRLARLMQLANTKHCKGSG